MIEGMNQRSYLGVYVCLSTVCGCDLVHSGFFHHSGEYICTEDFQRLYGTQCDSCDQYITGEVVSALGRTYHPHCFVCSICRYTDIHSRPVPTFTLNFSCKNPKKTDIHHVSETLWLVVGGSCLQLDILRDPPGTAPFITSDEKNKNNRD